MVAAVVLAPWAQPLRFRPLPGWRAGASGRSTLPDGPVPDVASPKESTAWMTRGVEYRDRPTADPPDSTLSRLPRGGIVVSAVVYQSARNTQTRISLRLERARRYPCCDGTHVAGGEYALAGSGPSRAYSVIVRVYFGSPPTRQMRAQAQRAVSRLELPPPR